LVSSNKYLLFLDLFNLSGAFGGFRQQKNTIRKKWCFRCRQAFEYSFEHIHYTIFPFTAQVRRTANFMRFSAFYVPFSSLGKNLSKISKLSRDV